MLDAIVRTLVRKHITHRLLLEWVTASESQRTLGSAPLDYLKRMWQAPVLAIGGSVAVVAWRPEVRPRRRAFPDRLGAFASCRLSGKQADYAASLCADRG